MRKTALLLALLTAATLAFAATAAFSAKPTLGTRYTGGNGKGLPMGFSLNKKGRGDRSLHRLHVQGQERHRERDVEQPGWEGRRGQQAEDHLQVQGHHGHLQGPVPHAHDGEGHDHLQGRRLATPRSSPSPRRSAPRITAEA